MNPSNLPSSRPAVGRSLSQWLVVAAVILVAIVTVLQGLWTDRWASGIDAEAMRRSARALEESFPVRFGDWEWDEAIQATSDPKELARAGAVGHVARTYRNARTRTTISTFVVCATPYDASAHTPDRCYPGAGFEIVEAEHRLKVPLSDGREAETFTGTFRKDNQSLRLFWTYGLKHRWVAPQLARISLQNERVNSVYKLYAIFDETKTGSAQGMEECKDFLAALLPALDAAVDTALEQPAAAGKGAGEAAAARTATAATR